MDELKAKYDDLNNLFYNLKVAVKECDHKDYKEEIIETMRRIQQDLEELEPQIFKQEESEQKEIENQFERSRF